MADEEVIGEVEAVEAVYGDDCVVLEKFPPHLHIHIKPRTADVSSQQFVEATIGIQASSKYPDEPPQISIVDSKGLDEQRQWQLIASLHEKAIELSSCLMLVSLCEGAVEMLNSMNHPDGNCPLCLYPLVDETSDNNSLPFMKLMSCFHCFHCECIIRWWKWLLMHRETNANSPASMSSLRSMEAQQGRFEVSNEEMGRCPVCRKLFLAKDIEHVLHLVGSDSPVTSSEAGGLNEDNIIHSDLEKVRRIKFESILKNQQEKNGLIEVKRHEVLLPGMYLPRSSAQLSAMPDQETRKQENENPAVSSRSIPGVSSSRPTTSKHRNSSGRKHTQRGRNSEKHVRQWVRRDNGSAN